MTAKKTVVLFSDGFEEIEFVTIVDVLRRAGVEVTTAAPRAGMVRGSRGISMQADRSVEGLRAVDFDAVVLPGGAANARTLAEDLDCQRLIKEARAADLWLGAICAAPIALKNVGLDASVRLTSHPSVRQELQSFTYVEDRVVRDGRLLTSRGPGTAMEFALALVEQLLSKEKSQEVARPMLVNQYASQDL